MTIPGTITLKVRNPVYNKRHLYAKNVWIPEFDNYTGQVIDNPEWLGIDYLTLLDITGFPRMITKENIVIAGETQVIPKTRVVEEWLWEVDSDSYPKKIYTVALKANIWSCTCPAFKFRYDCKHINKCKRLWKEELDV